MRLRKTLSDGANDRLKAFFSRIGLKFVESGFLIALLDERLNLPRAGGNVWVNLNEQLVRVRTRGIDLNRALGHFGRVGRVAVPQIHHARGISVIIRIRLASERL